MSFRFTNKVLDTFEEGKRVQYDWSRWIAWFRSIGIKAWVGPVLWEG